MSGKYIDEDYVDERMFYHPDSKAIWDAYDATNKKTLILWSENRLNQQEYIGTKCSYVDEYEFPRNLIDEAMKLGILDTHCNEGLATQTVQNQIYYDDKKVPESIKRACVQMISEYIEGLDYKDLRDLNQKGLLSELEDLSWKDDVEQKHDLPQSVYNIILYLRPSGWKSNDTAEITRA